MTLFVFLNTLQYFLLMARLR